MAKTIDCLLIGHNERDFGGYVQDVKKMGLHSGAYRDLNLSFLQYEGQPYHASDVFNLICARSQSGSPPLTPIRSGETFSATISYLGTYLNRRGFTFDFVNSFQDEKEELASKLAREDILTIAITTTLYVSVFPIVEVVNFIRRYNQTARIIIGGPFVSTQVRTTDSSTRQFLFQSLGADFYVDSSQGEATLVRLIDAQKRGLPVNDIANIYYRSGDGYRATPLLREDNKLSENMVDWQLFAHRLGAYINLRTSISCPFACAFCGFPQHAGKYQTADIAAIEEELNSLRKIESVKSLYLIDDTVNVPIKRFKEFLRMFIRSGYPFRWYSQIRCQFLDREMVELMKQSHCEGVFLGLESGNNQILDNMNKKSTVEEYLKGIALLKEFDIICHGSFVVGFPGETRDTVMDTVKLIEESGLDFYRTLLWYCEPITPIWKQREKYGLKGSHFEWSHNTMKAREASALVEEIFLSIKNSVWLPQYGFDFNTLFHLLQRGIGLNRVKHFLRIFNGGIKDKLIDPGKTEVRGDILTQLEQALTGEDGEDGDISAPLHLSAETYQDLEADFDLD
jgi:anaerobic magnesium-protoporphyrin IX monomethyl ester cyclase